MSLFLQYTSKLLLTFFILAILGYLGWFAFKQHKTGKEVIWRIVLWAYVGAIFCNTVLPDVDFGIYTQTGKPYFHILSRTAEMGGLNLIPFRTILEEIRGIPGLTAEDRLPIAMLNILGNLLLYVPVGFLLPAGKKSRLLSVLLFGLILSCGFEILQYLFGRSADIDDVLLHLLGLAAGYGLWKLRKKSTQF